MRAYLLSVFISLMTFDTVSSYALSETKGLAPNTIRLKNTPVSKQKNHGVNQGGLIELGHGIKLHVKKKFFEGPEQDSLVVSYLTSRLVQFLAPGQIVTVVIVENEGKNLVGSYEIPDFKNHEENLTFSFSVPNFKTDSKEKNGAFLWLALDLMDIIDRTDRNFGSALIDGIKKSVVVDVDMTGNFETPWLFERKTSTFLYRATEGSEERKSLAKMASISDKDISKVFLMAVKELERSLFGPFIKGPNSQLNKHYNTDYIMSKVLERKSQMKWAYEHLDLIRSENDELKISHAKDDIFGFFLYEAVKYYNTEMVKKLLDGGAKDADGRALGLAVSNKNLDSIELLLAHGAIDKNALRICKEAGRCVDILGK